jgi:transcription antitermination protein NusB
MISRRLLRVKVMQALYAYLKSENASINNSEKELQFSINKTYELYVSLFLLVNELARYAEKRIDIARDKKIPNPEDLNPNTKFIENLMIKKLRENQFIRTFVNNHKISWSNQPELIKALYNDLVKQDFYAGYMNSETVSFETDKKFVYDLLTEFIAGSEEFYNGIEEQSIYWNDEADYVVSMAGKTIKKFKAASVPGTPLMPVYKNEEDADFAKLLFRKVIVNQKEYEKLIEEFTKNWDFDRIAFMDILILMLAMAEIQEFESIPVKVTFNEYIEISKLYSTEKSSVFINGILDKIIQQQKENKLFVKKGRGLIGDN